MWVKMCSKEFGITPRKIGSDLTPKDQRKWTAIIVIWIFKLANQLTAFWNNLLALYTSRTLWHSEYEWFKYNLQHYLPWWMFFLSQSVHKQILCLTREISELHNWSPNKKSSSTSDQGHHVVILYSPSISFYPRVNPAIRFSHVLMQEHLPCSSMQAKLPKERSARGLAQGMRNYKEYSAFV